ncbi:MAG: hypothetical protein KC468_12425 [Myxococcales bacterium]|nr:hypothetical protein [Myxococcales bacterium]
MSHDFVGGHELDDPNARRLFNIVGGLGALTFLSLVTCVQLFNVHREALIDERAKQGSYLLNEYLQEQDSMRTGSGEYTPKVINTEPGQFKLQYVPLADARAKVLQDPNALKAGKPPPGWQHPDDLGGGAAAPAAPPAPVVPVMPPPGATGGPAPVAPTPAGTPKPVVGAPGAVPTTPPPAPAEPAKAPGH